MGSQLLHIYRLSMALFAGHVQVVTVKSGVDYIFIFCIVFEYVHVPCFDEWVLICHFNVDVVQVVNLIFYS